MTGNPEIPHTIIETSAPPPEEGVVSSLQLARRRIRTVEDVEAQERWQSTDDSVLRAIRSQFDSLALARTRGEETTIIRSLGLPKTDALLQAIRDVVTDSWTQSGDPFAQKFIDSLRSAKSKTGTVVDVIDLLTNFDTGAKERLDWWSAEAEGRFRYVIEKDLAELRNAKKQEECMEEVQCEDPSFELPPPQQDDMTTSMDELSEQKEGEPSGYFTVHPFWGGYYREDVFEEYGDGNRWKKRGRTVIDVSEQDIGLLREKRVSRGTVRGGAVTPLPLPYGFVPDISTLQTTGRVTIHQDSYGLWSIDARDSEHPVSFTVEIGIPVRSVRKQKEAPTRFAVEHPYVSAQSQGIIGGLSGTVLDKARALKGHVRHMLEYSNESALNDVYKNHPFGYFAAIEEYKKADCDVANAYYINLLSAAGIHARMALGHYVKMKGVNGAAVMNSGTRHAWTEIWNPEQKSWIRFDATPAKDPILDDERPDEQSEDEPGQGDYGEQDAPQFSQEELEKLKQEIEQLAQDAALKEYQKNVREFISEVPECTPEEAVDILAKIEAARRLRNSKGQVIRTTLGNRFTEIVESNYKMKPAWKGPVTYSEGDEMDDKVQIAKDVAAGISDPLGYVLETEKLELAQEYGGLDLYLCVDKSTSMNWSDPTTGKPKKDEQQIAAFLLLDSMFAFSYKTEMATRKGQLVSPLSIRSAVAGFQAGTAGFLKELGPTWKKKEWFNLWKGLESNVGGGTPAHLGLKEIRERIEKDIAEEAKKKPPAKPRIRMVAVFMDGGADDMASFLAEQQALEAMGVKVVNYGMTESARAVENLPNGRCMPSVLGMLEPVSEDIIEEAKKLQLNRKSRRQNHSVR